MGIWVLLTSHIELDDYSLFIMDGLLQRNGKNPSLYVFSIFSRYYHLLLVCVDFANISACAHCAYFRCNLYCAYYFRYVTSLFIFVIEVSGSIILTSWVGAVHFSLTVMVHAADADGWLLTVQICSIEKGYPSLLVSVMLDGQG